MRLRVYPLRYMRFASMLLSQLSFLRATATEREVWSGLMKAVHDVKRGRRAVAPYTPPHEVIVRTYLWAVLHDRPTNWARDPRHGPREVRSARLPSQPTMSRRLRSPAVTRMLEALGRYLAARSRRSCGWRSRTSTASR